LLLKTDFFTVEPERRRQVLLVRLQKNGVWSARKKVKMAGGDLVFTLFRGGVRSFQNLNQRNKTFLDWALIV